MWLTILSAVLRLIGLAEWFDGWLKARHARQQAQAVANSPTTKEELDETLERHDF
jgi:hypothetical protein